MPEKQIENWLVINWKNGSTRTRKSKPSASSLGTHELATELTLDVIIPEVEVDSLHATVKVPKPRVEKTELDDLDEDDSPDWLDVADEVVDDFLGTHGTDWSAWREYRDGYVIQTLRDSPTNPDIDDVETYLRNAVSEEIRQQDNE